MGVASAVLGSWQFWTCPYIQYQLAERFTGHAMSEQGAVDREEDQLLQGLPRPPSAVQGPARPLSFDISPDKIPKKASH